MQSRQVQNFKINKMTKSQYSGIVPNQDEIYITTDEADAVISVNNITPNSSGNVTLPIPTVNNPTITFTQGGVTKGTITLNQSSNSTIAFDAGGPSITVDQVYDDTSANAQSGVAIAGAGFLTSSSLNGYATQTWVGQQGYLTSSSIANMQTTGNLVTSISSSSTDSQYPSAKCMYDIVGDIETLLQAV